MVELELRAQFDAIKRTVRYILDHQEKLKDFLRGAQSICVSGCGSSFYVAKSTAMQFSQRAGITSYAIPAGDILVNFEAYENLLKDTTMLLLSRSGSTSELLMMAKRCRDCYPDMKIISVCAVEDAPISQLADLSVEIPWAFDQAVCQTRTVSNLYIGGLLLCALKSGDRQLVDEIREIVQHAEPFADAVEAVLEGVAGQPFENAVVLADSGMAGLAEEGALAFKEICQRPSNFYHVLDVRHGPILTIDQKTLVVLLVSQGDLRLQTELINDMRKRTPHVLVLRCVDAGDKVNNTENTGEIRLPRAVNDDVSAVFMLYCIQLLCLKHAVFRGVDPDKPEGLDPWIKLEI